MTDRHTMAAADAAWLGMDRPVNLMVINAVLWFDEPLDWDRARDVFRERIVERFPRFSQRVHEGGPLSRPFWKDDENFDIGLHLHRRALPAPGDRAALQEVVSDLVAQPLGRSRPLWDIYMLEGYGPGSALLMRMHHCIADGIALARVMMSLTDGADRADGASGGFRADDVPHRGRLATSEHLVGAALHEGFETVLHPRARAVALARTASQDARTLAKLMAPTFDPTSSLKGRQRIAHRVVWSAPVQLSRVKAIGRDTGTTVNDVLVAAVAGAVGRDLREHHDAVGEVHAMVPLNLRPVGQPLERDLGNKFGLISLPLPTGIEDPLERLRVVHDAMEAIKHSHEGPLVYGVLGALGRAPAIVEEKVIDFFSAKATMVLTNVPGPRGTVTLAGAPVRGVLVWAPCSGSVGMSVSVFSYAGKVTVGLLVDAGLVAEPQELADGFRSQLLLLARRAKAAAPVAAG
jgi:WS/DGAT/MGAT family acyltransferase